MKIYTKTGDKGTTSLYGGERVPKHNLRIESYGTLDELNAFIGLLRDTVLNNEHKDTLLNIQDKLFVIGSLLATPSDKEYLANGERRLKHLNIYQEDIDYLEVHIDKLDALLPQMTHFILPGGHTMVSYCHIARCVCRRAERIVSQLAENEDINTLILIYLNRLSDYLFVLARMLSKELQIEEIKWIPNQ